ncbi:MAG: zinc-binding dehydrogenase [SAR202 cluster bacterium]|nr:zinc-binding dehydrogenase [SAR202 cluster bacterium]
MKALLLEEAGPDPKLAFREIAEPDCGPGQVLVRVRACGLCRHDLAVMEGLLRRGVRLPLALGHEIAGEVEKVGASVLRIAAGDRVASLPVDACGGCPQCLTGREHRCEDGRGMGHGVHGGMAEYVAVREHSLVKLPSGIPWNQACLLACPTGVALKAVREAAQVKAGETVAVTGAGGGLGTQLVQAAKLSGARVLAVTSSQAKERGLKVLGADEVIVTNDLDWSEVALALTGDRGVDVVLDTVGSAMAASAVKALSVGGRLALLGEVEGLEAQLNLGEIIFREARIIGSLGADRRHLEEAARLWSTGAIRPVVGGTKPWEEAREAVSRVKGGQVLGRMTLEV